MDDTSWMQHTVQFGAGDAADGFPRIAVRLGASFELTGLLPSIGHRTLIRLESAAPLAAMRSDEPDESDALDIMRRRHGRLATRQVLSDSGLAELYRAVCTLRGVSPRRFGSARLIALAMQAADPECSRAVAMFCNLLGDVAGHATLTLAGRGGVYFGGELAALLGHSLTRSSFRRRFEGGGHASDFLRRVPTFVAAARPSRPAIAVRAERDSLLVPANRGGRQTPSHDRRSRGENA